LVEFREGVKKEMPTNSALEWFPRIEKAGLLVPKTRFVPYDHRAYCSEMEGGGGHDYKSLYKAVVAAALGPLPATGFAHHPAAEFVRFLGGHVGVSETGSPPTAPPPTEVLQGTDVTASRASELLGLPVAEPAYVPRGFQRVSSRYFPQALTGAAGGTFLLAYQRTAADGASVILIYQERPGSDIAIKPGSARDMFLPDGTPATYISGSWQPSGPGAEITWGDEGTQTMVFDRQGLRTILIYRGGLAIDQYELINVAGSLPIAP